jgi:hypothetical protein
MKKIFCLLFVLMFMLSFFACGGSDDKTYTISGTVNYGSTGLTNVTVTLSGAANASTTTNSTGSYSFTGLKKGNYSLTATLTGYTITLQGNEPTISGSNVTGVDFVATGAYSVQGTITVSGSGLSNVTVAASGAATGTATTNSSGSYTITGLISGDYTITPTRIGYSFDPVNTTAAISNTNVTGKDFTAIQDKYSIQGSVTVDGIGLPNVTVALTGASTGSATTDADGNYTLSDLLSGDYTVTPTLTDYTFSATSTAVTINYADATDKDFVGTRIKAAGYLHSFMPDQANWQSNFPTGTAAAAADIVLFAGYTPSLNVTISTGTYPVAYKVDQFFPQDDAIISTPDPENLLPAISNAGHDVRNLYAVVTRSNTDGFSNRSNFFKNVALTKIGQDLRWDQFNQGYLLDLENGQKIAYDASVTANGFYKTSTPRDVFLFRKIEVKRPDSAGTIAIFEPQATSSSFVDDTNFSTVINPGVHVTTFNVATKTFGTYTNVSAISLDQFITVYVTDVPSNYTYKIDALDGTYKDGWTYPNLQNSYYLPDYDLIIQVDGSNNVVDGTKINFPVKIELISGSTVEYAFTNKNLPAYAFGWTEGTK